MSEHEDLHRELGSYLLGSLAPADRAAVARHLAGCAECRAELAALAPLPGLLGLLDRDEVRGPAVAAPTDLLAPTLAAVRDERGRERRALRRWRLAAAAAAVLAVVGAGFAAVPPLLAPTTTSVPLAAMPGVTATGSGSVQTRVWGTAVQLDLSGLPRVGVFQAFARARDGHTEIAASWGATPSGRAVVAGATAIPRAELAAVEVRTADGYPLLTLSG